MQATEADSGDFPGGPVAKTLRSQRGGLGLIPGQGNRRHMLHNQSRETDSDKPEQEKGFIRKQETLVSNDDSVGMLVGVGRDGVGGITD